MYGKFLGTYNSDPRLKILDHIGVLDIAVNFWSEELLRTDILNQVDHHDGS